MNMVITAAILYAVMIVYLVVRGVEARRILQIVATGVVGGLLLAYTLGLAYFLIVLVKPAETIAVFSIAMLLLGAAYIAREQVLTDITPLGIIFLNIAANFVHPDGPLPLSLSWVAALIPIPHAPTQIALNLIVLYSPALIALAALRRGPPGDPWVRLLLGAWVCWVGIAALAGPGWNVISQFQADNPIQWLVCIAAAYAAVHVTMLALNLAFVVTGEDDESARSIARSVRIDHTPALRAFLLGAAFWAGMYVFVRLPLADQDKAGLAIAAAFVLGSMLKSKPAPNRRAKAPEAADIGLREKPSQDSLVSLKSFKLAGTYLLFLGIMGSISAMAWHRQTSRQRSWFTQGDFTDEDRNVEMLLIVCGSVTLMTIVMMACALYEGLSHARARRGIILSATVALFVGYRIIATPLSPAWRPAGGDQQSSPVAAQQNVGAREALGFPPTIRPGSGLTLGYNDPDDHKLLKEHLIQAGVPFMVASHAGKEMLHVAEEHRGAVEKIQSMMEGPDLPVNRSRTFQNLKSERAFTEWLTRKGVKWEIVKKRRQNWIVWEDGPRHEWLYRAFENGERVPWLGIDYYALEILARAAPSPEVDPDRAAAFEAPEYRRPFLAWLEQRGIKFETVAKSGREFVVWQTAGDNLLPKYLAEMRHKCLDELRAMRNDNAPGVLEKRC